MKTIIIPEPGKVEIIETQKPTPKKAIRSIDINLL